jgi:phosphate acetyltransferase
MSTAVTTNTSPDTQYSKFDALVERARQLPSIEVSVSYPLTNVALGGALESANQGLIRPVLVGPKNKILRLAETEKMDIRSVEIVDTEDEIEAARVAVSLCRSGRADALMKGSLHTDIFMKPVLARETGLRTVRRISHVFVMETPAYSRILLITDAAINILPTLEDKVDIVQNAIDLAQVLGVPQPRVAILSAVETVQSSIESTIHAAALCKMAERGQITGGILDGPLAFDTAVSPEANKIKHLQSAVSGQADIVVVPDLESGNMLAKQLEYLGGARMAGIVLGTSVPIILTSRADNAMTRMTSAALAVLLHDHNAKVSA